MTTQNKELKTQNKELAASKKNNITDLVLKKVNEFAALGEMRIPKGYSPENALKSAYLLLLETKTKDSRPVLEACTKDSVANALLNMVVQGLSPMKQQCSFVAYGDKLILQRQYQGNIALAKRYGGVKDVSGNVIYKGDTFAYEINYETGKKKVTNHKQSLENMDGEIIGAYAVITNIDGSVEYEIMTKKKIELSWMQGSMRGNSPAHKNFADQMSIKTVINRACKFKIQSSDDTVLLVDDDNNKDYVVENSKEEINTNANKEEVDFEEVEEVNLETVEVTERPENAVIEDKSPNKQTSANKDGQTIIGPSW